MCSSNSNMRFLIPGAGPSAFSEVDLPKVKKPKTLSEGEKRRRAQERAVRAAERAQGGYGHADTNKTGGSVGAPGAGYFIVGVVLAIFGRTSSAVMLQG